MTTIRKNCAACWAPISVRLADHKRGWGRFCDKSCAAAHKAGMRPRDVSRSHARHSEWAKAALDRRDAAGVEVWPTEPGVPAQVGKVKVVPTRHSPCRCRKCGEPNDLNGPGLCIVCDDYEPHPFSEEAVQGEC